MCEYFEVKLQGLKRYAKCNLYTTLSLLLVVIILCFYDWDIIVRPMCIKSFWLSKKTFSNNDPKLQLLQFDKWRKSNEDEKTEDFIPYVVSSDNRTNTLKKQPGYVSGSFCQQPTCQRIIQVTMKNSPSIAVSAIDDSQSRRGRLGNKLSNFASGYAIWRDFGILNYMDPEQLRIIGEVFQLPTYNAKDDNASYYVWMKGVNLL